MTMPNARAGIAEIAMPTSGSTRGRFIVLEGLSCSGKTTVAPLLADALKAGFFQTPLRELRDLRFRVDDTYCANARLHFWMMANYAVSEQVRTELNDGRMVVLESYFYRTLATHAAIGVNALPEVDWQEAVAPDVAVLLQVDESVRQQRMRDRGRRPTYWSQREEANIDETRQKYDSFGLQGLDTTWRSPAQVVADLVDLVGETSHAERRTD